MPRQIFLGLCSNYSHYKIKVKVILIFCHIGYIGQTFPQYKHRFANLEENRLPSDEKNGLVQTNQ